MDIREYSEPDYRKLKPLLRTVQPREPINPLFPLLDPLSCGQQVRKVGNY